MKINYRESYIAVMETNANNMTRKNSRIALLPLTPKMTPLYQESISRDMSIRGYEQDVGDNTRIRKVLTYFI